MPLLDLPLPVTRATRGMRVNWRHPLARALCRAVVPVGNGAIDLVDGSRWRFAGSTAVPRMRPSGLSLGKTSGYAPFLQREGPLYAAVNTNLLSCFMLAYDVSDNSALLGDGGSGWEVFGGKLRLFISSTAHATGATTLPTTGEVRIGFTCANGDYRNYYNGILDGSSGLTYNVAGPVERIGYHSTSPYGNGFYFTLILQWRRILSAEECRVIARNPFALFELPSSIYLPDSASQFARPSADTITDFWRASSGNDLYAMMNETPASDANYAFTEHPDASMLVKVQALTTPGSGSKFIRYRVNGGTYGGAVLCALYQGSTLIEYWVDVAPPGYALYTHTITNAGSISNWSDLYVAVQAGPV